MEKRAKLDTEREKEKAEAYKRIVKRVIKVILLNESNTVPTDELLEEAASTIWNFTKDLEEVIIIQVVPWINRIRVHSLK